MSISEKGVEIEMNKKGFTLIELLIVVAIIAILAAIAIPNFLAAQVRAKYSRAKSEMRSVATALESYQVDYGQYVCRTTVSDGLYRTQGNGTRLCLTPLTTPVGYITSVPTDPFIANATWPETYVYYCDMIQRGPLWGSYDVGLWYWGLWSFGPNSRSDWGELYDPSNGTVSNGDVHRFGP